MKACEINLEYRYHTRAVQRKVILSHKLFQDLILLSSMKFSTHTHTSTEQCFRPRQIFQGHCWKITEQGSCRFSNQGQFLCCRWIERWAWRERRVIFKNYQDIHDIKCSIKNFEKFSQERFWQHNRYLSYVLTMENKKLFGRFGEEDNKEMSEKNYYGIIKPKR